MFIKSTRHLWPPLHRFRVQFPNIVVPRANQTPMRQIINNPTKRTNRRPGMIKLRNKIRSEKSTILNGSNQFGGGNIVSSEARKRGLDIHREQAFKVSPVTPARTQRLLKCEERSEVHVEPVQGHVSKMKDPVTIQKPVKLLQCILHRA